MQISLLPNSLFSWGVATQNKCEREKKKEYWHKFALIVLKIDFGENIGPKQI